MNEVKQILLLYVRQRCSIKQIAKQLSVSKNTVKEYLRKYSECGLSLEEVLEKDVFQLSALFTGNTAAEDARHRSFLNRVEYYAQELKNRHVTRQLLWEEDFKAGLIEYRYSRFCFHLNNYLKGRNISMTMHHTPGDKAFLDYAGDKLKVIDVETNTEKSVEVLALTMGYSNYTVVLASPSQKSEDFISALDKAVRLLGAVPEAFVCDNFKAAVTQTDRYEPQVNEAFLAWAAHYGTTILPARPAKPKDKAKVERAVNHVYQQVYARIRNRSFTSIEELNSSLLELSIDMNNRQMKDYGASRKELFEREEKPVMRALPAEPYEHYSQHRLKVSSNSHVFLSRRKQHYSVPYHLIGQYVSLLVSSSLVKIYHGKECVATHAMRSGRYITEAKHLPSHYNDYKQALNPEVLIERAERIGPEVRLIVDLFLKRTAHPEQNFKSCLGILNMVPRECTKERLAEACQAALNMKAYSYKFIRTFCKSPYADTTAHSNQNGALPRHSNIRGSQSYQ